MTYITPFRVSVVKENTDRYPQLASERITCPSMAADLVSSLLADSPNERVICLWLNSKCQVTGFSEIASGTINGCMVDAREIFRGAVVHGAVKIILAHNHPSGDITPSRDDNALTERVQEAGKILGINLVDHIIVGDGCQTYSYQVHGLLD